MKYMYMYSSFMCKFHNIWSAFRKFTSGLSILENDKNKKAEFNPYIFSKYYLVLAMK